MPTILDWLGGAPPAACDGRSLLPWLSGHRPDGWRTHAHWEFDFRDVVDQAPECALGLSSDDCQLAVLRGERYEYVHFPGLPPLLFDTAEDPDRLRDLAGCTDRLPVLAECAGRMLSWRMRHAERAFTHQMLGPGGVVERVPTRGA